MKSIITAILLVGMAIGFPVAAAQEPDGIRDQDLGAYSREALDAARVRLKDTLVVVFAGGRHGFVKGQRVSLDPDRWQTEAEIIKGKVMVPERFALSAFGIKHLPWFGFRIAQKGKMVAIADLAARLGKKVFTEERGLVIVGDEPVTLDDSQLIDSMIVLFDTPEKFADPQIAYRNIPSLKAWGRWAEHVEFTPDQLELYDEPEMQWRLISERRYEKLDLGMQELGSEVPPPGVHPHSLRRERCPADPRSNQVVRDGVDVPGGDGVPVGQDLAGSQHVRWSSLHQSLCGQSCRMGVPGEDA